MRPCKSAVTKCLEQEFLKKNGKTGRTSACTNFVIFYRFRRFSTFAEEGFTCLDHSMLSKKKTKTLRVKVFGIVICRLLPRLNEVTALSVLGLSLSPL